jgi:hypothetical protein
MATGAGMLGTIRMHASHQSRGFVGVAGLHFTFVTVLRMRIFLDGCVAIAAFQAAVDAGMKLRPIHCNAVSRPILQALVRMAGQAIRLCMDRALRRHKQKRG